MKSLVRQTLDGLIWSETFIWIGLHCFWVLSKSSPLSIDNPASVLLAVIPFVILLLAGAASLNLRIQGILIQLESVLHWTASLFQVFLLFHVVWQNPMEPVLPLSFSLFLWSCCLSFILLANLAAHLRRQQFPETHTYAFPTIYQLFLLIACWGISLWLAAGMTWPVYFWTVSIILHAVLAPLSLNRKKAEYALPQKTYLRLEPFLLLGMFFLVQICSINSNIFMGNHETKYLLYLSPFSSGLFFLGVAIFLTAARIHKTLFSHMLLILILLFASKENSWAFAFVSGYALPALFCAIRRQTGFIYSLCCLLIMVVWILGLTGFSFSGLIIHFGYGADFIQTLIIANKIFLVLLSVALLIEAARAWHKQFTCSQESIQTPVTISGKAVCALVFVVLLCAAIIPDVLLLMSTTWPPRILKAPVQITVGKPMGICHAGYSETDEEYQLLGELGVQSIRIDFHWSRFQPTPEEWNVSARDSFVNMATKHNTQVIAILDFDNDAVEMDLEGKTRSPYIAPSDIPLFLEYVRQVVSHYKDSVYAWEIWNEPDIARFWNGPIEEFYVLAQQTAETVRSVDESAIIIGPACTGPLGALMAKGIEGLHKEGALVQVDHPGAHLYLTNPRHYYAEFAKLIGIARRFNHPGSIWMTELGAPDGGYYPWCASDEMLAHYVIKAYAVTTKLGIDHVVWFCFRDSGLQDQAKEPIDSERFFGLLGPGDQWKPSAHAYSLFSRHCSNSVIRNDLVQVSGGLAARQVRSAFYRRDTGESSLILWFEPTLRPWGTARAHIDFGDDALSIKTHDIASGYTKTLIDDHVDLTEKPLFITFEPGATDNSIHITVDGSPTDMLWLLFVTGILGVSILVGLWGMIGRESTYLRVR